MPISSFAVVLRLPRGHDRTPLVLCSECNEPHPLSPLPLWLPPARFRKALQSCGVKLHGNVCRQLFQSLDTDRDGEVNYEEFLQVHAAVTCSTVICSRPS